MEEKEFNSIVQSEKILYLGTDKNRIKRWKRSHHKRYTIWKYLYYFRCCQYWRDVRKNPPAGTIAKRLAKYRFLYYDKKRNIYSEKSGVEIGIDSSIGINPDIWHSGIVINGDIGDNCTFHGNNILGNKGKGNETLKPVIGNNVDIGAGAIIIGNVKIADDCIVGAGAVVTKSFETPGSVIAGVPGKVIKSREN